MKKIASLLFVVAGTSVASAQLSYTGAALTENFDSLNVGTAVATATYTWSNNSTLPGWQVFAGSSGSNIVREATTNPVSIYRAGVGGSNTGGIWSYGSTDSTERALGVAASASFESVIILVIQNNSGVDLTSFGISYDGEQWRNGGNTAAQSLVFDFTVLSVMPTAADVSANNTTNYTAVPALDFTSPTTGATAASLDGNAAANRVAGITSNVNAVVPNGHYLVLRWWDNNDIGNDHGLAIDNFSFIPTPGSTALLGLGLLAAGRRRRA